MRLSRPLPQTSAAVILFVASFVAPSAAASKDRSALGHVAIGNFGKVSDTYYRGEQPDPADYASLAALGVKMVIDLQQDGDPTEPRRVERAGMKFVRIPMVTDDRPSEAAVTQFLALINDSANLPVYVHCKGGRHRTGVMTAVYRMTKDGWTADRAYAEMKDYGFKVPFDFLFGHPELKEFVYDFYGKLKASH